MPSRSTGAKHRPLEVHQHRTSTSFEPLWRDKLRHQWASHCGTANLQLHRDLREADVVVLARQARQLRRADRELCAGASLGPPGYGGPSLWKGADVAMEELQDSAASRVLLASSIGHSYPALPSRLCLCPVTCARARLV